MYRRTVLTIVLFGSALLFLAPFLWQLRTAFTAANQIFSAGTLGLPVPPTIEHLKRVVVDTEILVYVSNGLVVTSAILGGQLLVSVPAAYALARYRFCGERLVMTVVIAAIVFPGFISAVPNFLLVAALGVVNTRVALVLPFWGSAFAVFLFRQSMRRIPQDYHDAATIDGCGVVGTIRHVSLPMITPAVSAFSVFSVVTHWNDLFWPLVVIRSSRLFTPPAGVLFFANSEFGTEWGPVSAAALITILPMVLLFLVMRTKIEDGLSAAVLK